jgi:NRPS condensation-like uncharacterized protein
MMMMYTYQMMYTYPDIIKSYQPPQFELLALEALKGPKRPKFKIALLFDFTVCDGNGNSRYIMIMLKLLTLQIYLLNPNNNSNSNSNNKHWIKSSTNIV